MSEYDLFSRRCRASQRLIYDGMSKTIVSLSPLGPWVCLTSLGVGESHPNLMGAVVFLTAILVVNATRLIVLGAIVQVAYDAAMRVPGSKIVELDDHTMALEIPSEATLPWWVFHAFSSVERRAA